MTKTEKAALQESVVQVGAALLINFPLQTFLLWLFIERWEWTSAILRMEIEKRRRHGLWRKVRNSGSR